MSTGIGEKIKQKRKELGLSQEELAARMGLKSKSTICKVERGDDNLTNETICKYAAALHTTPLYLMGHENAAGIEPTETPVIPESGLSLDETKKAYELFSLYENATPEVRSAVELLLKSAQQDS